jgi:hypothetical protein
VRGTGQRQLLRAEAKGIGSTRLDERDGLKWFCRGPEVGNVLGIAVASEQSPGDVGNDDDARVGALDQLSTRDFR